METKELNGYKIQFYSEEEWNKPYYFINDGRKHLSNGKYLNYKHKLYSMFEYVGLVNEISEELVEKIVGKIGKDGEGNIHYENYKKPIPNKSTAKESFQTLNNLEYCVITKI